MIFSNSDISLEITVINYEIPHIVPDKESFDYDANWLMLKYNYTSPTETITYKDPTFLVYEIINFIKELENLAANNIRIIETDFMEPELSFKFITNDDKTYSLDLGIHLHQRKPQDDFEEEYFSFILSKAELNDIITEFKQWVTDFPERGLSLYCN